MTDLGIVLRSLRARPLATLLAAASVAVATALLLTLLSLQRAGERSFLRGAGNAHLLVSADAGPLVSVLNALFYANPPQRPLTSAKVVEILDSFPWQWAIPLQQGDSFRGYPVLATTPEFFTRFEAVDGEPWRFAEGRAFERNFEAVLGATVAANTGLRLGAELVFTHGAAGHGGHEHREYAFRVVGILAPTGSPHDRALFTDLESSWILHAHDRREAAGLIRHVHGGPPQTTVADLLDEDRLVTGLLLRLPTRPGSAIPGALQAQFDRLRRDPTLTVASPADQISKLLSIVGRIDVLFLAMAGAILVGSALTILIAMHATMRERRRQVAIFRVLGSSRGRILQLVLAESALIGLAGAAAGLVLSLLGTALASAYLRREAGVVLDPTVDPRSALLVAAMTVVLSALAGLLPAVLAYRTPVADHLRPNA